MKTLFSSGEMLKVADHRILHFMRISLMTYSERNARLTEIFNQGEAGVIIKNLG